MRKVISLLVILVLCFLSAIPVMADPKATVYSNCSSWAYNSLESAAANGLLPEIFMDADMTQPITRAEFAAVSVALWEALSDEKATPAANGTFSDTNDTGVLKAFNLGLTSGISAEAFGPDIVLNREQMAAMLSRVYKKVYIPDWTLETDGAYGIAGETASTFADHQQISAWAVDSVYFMFQMGAISGLEASSFSPQSTATREQAVVAAAKSYIDAGDTIERAILSKHGSSAQNEPDKGTQSSDALGSLSAEYFKILGSGNYYMKYRTEMDIEGENITGTFETAIKGDDYAQIADMNGMINTMIMLGGKMHMVDHENRMVMVMSVGIPDDSAMQNYAPDSGFVYIGTGTAPLFGVNYTYEEYATDAGNVRYFFDGSKLAGIEMTGEDTFFQMEILELSTDIPESMFDIPTDYEKIVI